MSSEMRVRGTIKKLKAQEGWGFIRRDDGRQPDVFVHRSGTRAGEWEGLTEGDLVDFAVVPNDRGPRAEDLARVEAST